jgi:trehalose 6-phosphate phosphatase
MSVSQAHKPPPAEIGWAYFLDVDGTLLDIAETPNGIHVDAGLLDLIGRLSRACDGAVALVSGRALSDLDNWLGVLRLPMAGQHGLERRDVGGRLWIHAPPPEAKAAIKATLAPVLERHPALLLEDKGLALALHYRRAPSLAAYAHRLMAQLAAGAGGAFELQKCKRVVELKPAGIDKGTAIAEYMAEPPFQGRRPVFIGDDANDEHGFAEINRVGGISIRVGPGRSCARYRLANVAGVRHWLASALKI